CELFQGNLLSRFRNFWNHLYYCTCYSPICTTIVKESTIYYLKSVVNEMFIDIFKCTDHTFWFLSLRWHCESKINDFMVIEILPYSVSGVFYHFVVISCYSSVFLGWFRNFLGWIDVFDATNNVPPFPTTVINFAHFVYYYF